MCKRVKKLEEYIKTHSFLLLGDPRHGDTSAETLINYCEFRQQQSVAQRTTYIFLESYPYDEVNGVNEDRLREINREMPGLLQAKLEMLQKLRGISQRVIGLETEATALFSKSQKEKQDFERKRRCIVSNEEWAKLVQREGAVGSLNVVCCGTAHLVSVKETDGESISVEQHLKRLRIDGTKSLAVVNEEREFYKPADSTEEVERMDPIDEDFLEAKGSDQEGSDKSDSDD